MWGGRKKYIKPPQEYPLVCHSRYSLFFDLDMGSSTARRGSPPERGDVIAGSFAIHSNERRIGVWQYQVDISAPDGEWRFVETFDHDDDPKRTLGHATLTAPSEGGYWMYSKFYDCKLDCE